MKKYHIKIKDELVHKTNNKKEALKVITKIFNDGHEEVSLHGGRLGSWWNK
jgi:hypothetical protein